MSNIILPAAMLGASQALRSKGETFYRDGIPLEKGAVLTEKRIKKNLKLYQQYMELFISYPDLYLELIKPIGSKFKLKFFHLCNGRNGRLFAAQDFAGMSLEDAVAKAEAMPSVY